MSDVDRARRRAAKFGKRHPDVLEVWLGGSRAGGTAAAESDFDFLVLVTGTGELRPDRFVRLQRFDWLTPRSWCWLKPDDLNALRLTPKNVPCDIMLADESSLDYRVAGYQDGWRPQLLRGIADRWRHHAGAQIRL